MRFRSIGQDYFRELVESFKTAAPEEVVQAVESPETFVMSLEFNLQRSFDTQPMSREEVRETLMRVRRMRDRIHHISAPLF